MILVQYAKDERYYHVHEQETFFTGKVDLICSWGAFDSNKGGHKIFTYCNDEEKQEYLSKIDKQRISRKYKRY